MMKNYLFVVMLFCCLPLASADDYKQMSIENIRVYVNDVRVKDVDKFGGDIEDVLPLDVVEFKIDLKNLNADEKLTDILIYGEIPDIDDGDDLEEDLSEFDLRKGEEDTRSLIFNIPDVAEEDDYGVDLKIRGVNINGTEEYFNVTYDLAVQEKSGGAKFSISEAFRNVTDVCREKNDLMNNLDSRLNSLKEECVSKQQDTSLVTSCEEEKKGFVNERDNCNTAKLQLQNDYNNLNSEYTSLKLENGGCVSELDTLKNTKKVDWGTGLVGLVLGLGAGYYWWVLRPQKRNPLGGSGGPGRGLPLPSTLGG